MTRILYSPASNYYWYEIVHIYIITAIFTINKFVNHTIVKITSISEIHQNEWQKRDIYW